MSDLRCHGLLEGPWKWWQSDLRAQINAAGWPSRVAGLSAGRRGFRSFASEPCSDSSSTGAHDQRCRPGRSRSINVAAWSCDLFDYAHNYRQNTSHSWRTYFKIRNMRRFHTAEREIRRKEGHRPRLLILASMLTLVISPLSKGRYMEMFTLDPTSGASDCL